MNQFDELYLQIKEKYYESSFPVKKDISKKNFLNFILKEIKKINEWNSRNKLIKFTAFNLNIRLVEDFKLKLDELFLENVLPSTRYLDRIIQNGWQFGALSIAEYNQIVYFTDFCNKMSVIEKSKIISHKDFVKMENAFLKITRDEKTPEQIIKGLEKILVFYNKSQVKGNDEKAEILKKLEYFFIPNFFYPSFYDMILAYNMVYYKQYLNWSDLFNADLNRTVQNKFYECPEETFNDIIRYIKEMKRDIDLLTRDKNRIEWLKKLSEIKSIENPDLIVKFYESNQHDWNKDNEDLLLLILILIEDIINKMDEMLHDDWTVMDNNEKTLSIRILRDNEIEVLYNKLKTDYDLAKIKHLNNLPIKTPLREYFRKDYPGSLFTDNNQKYIYNKIIKMFGCLREIAMILKKYYDPLDEYIAPGSMNKFMIVKPQEWRGEPVFSVFKFYILLFLQICGYFRENDLLSDIRKLQEIDIKLSDKNEKLENIMGNDDFIKNIIGNNSTEKKNE